MDSLPYDDEKLFRHNVLKLPAIDIASLLDLIQSVSLVIIHLFTSQLMTFCLLTL